MTGGTTTQSGSWSSGVNFAPNVSGNGNVSAGNITTGASGGGINGSSTGSSTSVSATIPAGLLNLILDPMTGLNQATETTAQYWGPRLANCGKNGVMCLQNLDMDPLTGLDFGKETTAQYWGPRLAHCPKG